MNVVTPSLRFIGFQGRWHEANLEGISIKNISYGIVQTGEYIDDGVPCIRVVDLTKAKINKKTLIKASDEISNSYRKTILEEGELMIALRGEIGLTQLVFEELVGCNLTRGVARVSPNKNLYDTRFLCAFLNSAKVRQEFDRRKNGSALKEIPISELKKFPVFFPELKEQQKIADFLTSVDTKISQLTEKHHLLKDYKKGVMQQIFSQQIRFKDDDGNAFPEWKEKGFNDVFNRVTTKNKENNENVLTISAQKGLISQLEYFNKSVSAKDVTGYYLLHKGDFAYNKSYSKGYPMGAIKPLKYYEKGVVSTLYICFRPEADYCEHYFEQYFDAGMLNREIAKIAQEGARNHGLLNVSVTEFFEDIKLTVPHIDEQQKIAQFLQSLDKKIDAVNEQIEQTKLFKKGLLQQMFV